MQEAKCSVCSRPCEITENELCDKCRAMDEGLARLIADNEKMAIKYLETRLASLKERMQAPPLIDQRKKQVLFSPLRRKADRKMLWSHTPDRRTEQYEPSQKRRRSNGAERRKTVG